ncbi:VOC family protein [Candidatus Kapabacteria bacterium]|nr:VOC family protein [Candidatus Kapabacteria bacterium]
MKLGAFSISLNVKDINASREFYSKLGFSDMGGDISQNWLIMKNGDAIIGLFQSMFPSNIITLNPGWDQNAQNISDFDDIRTIQSHIKESGLKLESEADEKTTGPASLTLIDPDGNVILIDQHR